MFPDVSKGLLDKYVQSILGLKNKLVAYVYFYSFVVNITFMWQDLEMIHRINIP